MRVTISSEPVHTVEPRIRHDLSFTTTTIRYNKYTFVVYDNAEYVGQVCAEAVNTHQIVFYLAAIKPEFRDSKSTYSCEALKKVIIWARKKGFTEVIIRRPELHESPLPQDIRKLGFRCLRNGYDWNKFI